MCQPSRREAGGKQEGRKINKDAKCGVEENQGHTEDSDGKGHVDALLSVGLLPQEVSRR